MHNGFVNINQEKMSKSLGNFFTIREILKKYDPEVVRFFIITAHYRSPIDFSDQNLEEAKTGLSRFYELLKAADELLIKMPPPPKAPCPTIADSEREIYDRIELLEERFAEAMDDDFNTALAIGHLFDAVRGLNRLITEKRFDDCPLSLAVLNDGIQKLRQLGDVLGLFGSDPVTWLEKQKSAGLEGGELTAEAIEALIEERKQARADRNFTRSDEIRDELDAKGVILLDSREGTTWKLK
jgi:cysteinyl-tRNA synthetase